MTLEVSFSQVFKRLGVSMFFFLAERSGVSDLSFGFQKSRFL